MALRCASSRGREIELGLHGLPSALERGRISLARNAKWTAGDDPAAPEREIDLGAVPGIERDVIPGRDRSHIYRPPRNSGKPDDAQTGAAGHLRHIGRQRHRAALLQRRYHLIERADPAFARELAAVIAGAADRADTEMLRGDRVDLAVAMTRDQHLGGTIAAHGAANEGKQVMLSVPHAEDDRQVAPGLFQDSFRLERETRRRPYQTKVFGRHDPHCLLKRTRADQALDQGHRGPLIRFQRASRVSVSGSSRRCMCTMK